MAKKQTYITDAKVKGEILDRLDYLNKEMMSCDKEIEFYQCLIREVKEVGNEHLLSGFEEERIARYSAHREKYSEEKSQILEVIAQSFVAEDSKRHLQKVAVLRKLDWMENEQEACIKKATISNPDFHKYMDKASVYQKAHNKLAEFAREKGFFD